MLNNGYVHNIYIVNCVTYNVEHLMIIALSNSAVRQSAGGVLMELIEAAPCKDDSRCDNLHPYSFLNSAGSVRGRQRGTTKENRRYSRAVCGGGLRLLSNAAKCLSSIIFVAYNFTYP